MMKKNFQLLKGLVIDFIVWIYLLGCFSFLSSEWFDLKINLFIVLFLGILLTVFTFTSKCSLGYSVYNKDVIRRRYGFRFIFNVQIILLCLITFIVGWVVVDVKPLKFVMKIRNAKHIVNGIFTPNWNILKPMLKALIETIYLALLATVFAIPAAFVLSFFAARNLMTHSWFGNTIYVSIRTIATIFRSIEAIVWAIIFSVWVGIGPFAGMLALMIHSIAALTKLYSEQIENIDPGPIEAIKATGANTIQVWIFAVIPQIISPFLAFTIYRWDINVRMATIVGFVGGGGIGLALQQEQQLLRWHNVGLIMWLIALVVWLMDMISGKVRQKLIEK